MTLLFDGTTATDPDPWALVSDQVMGGVSDGTLTLEKVAGRRALRMQGDVRLENDGGFLQMARDVDPAPEATGLTLTLRGNGADYNVHLRTDDLSRPWQSFRATVSTTGDWQDVTIPFADLTPHRTDARFRAASLTRLGLVAIGAAFEADLALSHAAFLSD